MFTSHIIEIRSKVKVFFHFPFKYTNGPFPPYFSNIITNRRFNEWLNKSFNNVDEQRLKKFGPDRTCTEWLLRNGGKVLIRGKDEYLKDYNKIPKEGSKFYIQGVDATGSSIAHYGFKHFKGCKYIEKAIFHECNYIYDIAFKDLVYLQNSLLHLQISGCPNVSETGLLHLKPLINLSKLVLFALSGVSNPKSVVESLKSALPKCDIEFK